MLDLFLSILSKKLEWKGGYGRRRERVRLLCLCEPLLPLYEWLLKLVQMKEGASQSIFVFVFFWVIGILLKEMYKMH